MIFENKAIGGIRLVLKSKTFWKGVIEIGWHYGRRKFYAEESLEPATAWFYGSWNRVKERYPKSNLSEFDHLAKIQERYPKSNLSKFDDLAKIHEDQMIIEAL